VIGGHVWELAIVLIIALVIFGPKRLPEIGGAMGKGIREFKKGTSDLGETVTHHESDTPAQIAAPPQDRDVSHVSSTAREPEGR
jgi:TatA/E family protein of Tat protein translocase